MKYRKLGHSGIAISRFALGKMYFGSETSEADAFAIMDRYVEAGGKGRLHLLDQILACDELAHAVPDEHDLAVVREAAVDLARESLGEFADPGGDPAEGRAEHARGLVEEGSLVAVELRILLHQARELAPRRPGVAAQFVDEENQPAHDLVTGVVYRSGVGRQGVGLLSADPAGGSGDRRWHLVPARAASPARRRGTFAGHAACKCFNVPLRCSRLRLRRCAAHRLEHRAINLQHIPRL